jgi:hypothetical protein
LFLLIKFNSESILLSVTFPVTFPVTFSTTLSVTFLFLRKQLLQNLPEYFQKVAVSGHLDILYGFVLRYSLPVHWRRRVRGGLPGVRYSKDSP